MEIPKTKSNEALFRISENLTLLQFPDPLKYNVL